MPLNCEGWGFIIQMILPDSSNEMKQCCDRFSHGSNVKTDHYCQGSRFTMPKKKIIWHCQRGGGLFQGERFIKRISLIYASVYNNQNNENESKLEEKFNDNGDLEIAIDNDSNIGIVTIAFCNNLCNFRS